jgi:formylmethanofuran dehydrogenase subunit E
MLVPPEDLPGRPLKTAQCEACGEIIRDGREVEAEGRTLCRACANGPYYSV